MKVVEKKKIRLQIIEAIEELKKNNKEVDHIELTNAELKQFENEEQYFPFNVKQEYFNGKLLKYNYSFFGIEIKIVEG